MVEVYMSGSYHQQCNVVTTLLLSVGEATCSLKPRAGVQYASSSVDDQVPWPHTVVSGQHKNWGSASMRGRLWISYKCI